MLGKINAVPDNFLLSSHCTKTQFSSSSHPYYCNCFYRYTLIQTYSLDSDKPTNLQGCIKANLMRSTEQQKFYISFDIQYDRNEIPVTLMILNWIQL